MNTIYLFQKLAPVWEKLAESLEFEPSVSIAKVDCTQFRTICNNFDVKGYPTLLWIEDGKKVKFTIFVHFANFKPAVTFFRLKNTKDRGVTRT